MLTEVEIVDLAAGCDAPLPQPTRTVKAAIDQPHAKSRRDTS
jgi:hypothetical protein